MVRINSSVCSRVDGYMEVRTKRWLGVASGTLVAAGLIGSLFVSRPHSSGEDQGAATDAIEAHVAGRTELARTARIASYDEARRNLDPKVFQPLGPRTYQIVRLGEARPPGDALSFVEGLLPRARAGDSNASFEIYLALRDCQNYISGEADKAFALEVEGGVDPRELSTSERKLAECESLAKSSSVWNESWLEMSARQGSVEAQLMYAVDVTSVLGPSSQRLSNPEKTLEWKETAKAYLQQVASTGNLDAIVRLSGAYGRGVYVERSAEMSYAYALTANKMKPGTFDSAFIESLEKDLPMKQQESARSLSRSIYNACCVQ